ncbi:MAG: prepilin-type N-terminal cleavage/methylation domain-containing protein [Candidatus Riflebacteria bacterium]|nr:prepilin-type N-terminal cleavage/methylation domain-containing protein [Candidatus Riflebacteria bacterium]
MRIFDKKRFGFTLVEIMVAIVLGSFVLGVAFALWSRVTREVTRSATRQVLQHQLRMSMDTLSRDLKAIKSGTLKAPADKQSPDGSKAYLEFERFTELENGKLAEKTTQKVVYELTGSLLTRTSGNEKKILSANILSLEMSKGVDKNTLLTTNLETTNPDHEMALNARIDISITGQKVVPGTKIYEYHVERTSVVMRDEYQKTVNKNFLSTDQVSQLGQGKVSNTDPNSSYFTSAGLFTEEQLANLTLSQLNSLDSSQKNLLEQAEKNLTDLNSNIGAVNTGGGWFSDVNLGWFGRYGNTDVQSANDLKSAIEGATTQAALNSALDKAQEYLKSKEASFISSTFSSKFPSEASVSALRDSDDKAKRDEYEKYKKAYDLLVQDRAMEGAYQKMINSSPPPNPVPPPPESAVARATAVPEKSSDYAETEEQFQQRVKDASDLKAICDAGKQSLTWMGNPGEETTEIQAYQATKMLYNYGQSKNQLLGMRDDASKNLELITKAKTGKS